MAAEGASNPSAERYRTKINYFSKEASAFRGECAKARSVSVVVPAHSCRARDGGDASRIGGPAASRANVCRDGGHEQRQYNTREPVHARTHPFGQYIPGGLVVDPGLEIKATDAAGHRTFPTKTRASEAIFQRPNAPEGGSSPGRPRPPSAIKKPTSTVARGEPPPEKRGSLCEKWEEDRKSARRRRPRGDGMRLVQQLSRAPDDRQSGCGRARESIKAPEQDGTAFRRGGRRKSSATEEPKEPRASSGKASRGLKPPAQLEDNHLRRG
ncbi:hypothetical protein HPB50_004429 [Hyalomma asiaticum]|uniref:Uncharacterized protein n=1 Tax=Hyalomma asiaticum TaxID=266040 RepID=A0ACB7TEB2_HYAAI|nr:hypothetical protein HPB50_004429 [Hyalomma asiaticum]